MSEIKPDFGYGSPRKTKRPCANPEFMDRHLHRVAIMKDEYWGDGAPGWTVKHVCTGCGREFKAHGFYPERTFQPRYPKAFAEDS